MDLLFVGTSSCLPDIGSDTASLLINGKHLGDVRIETRAAVHVSGEGRPEPALSYRFTDPATGACVVYSGDTSYDPGLGAWARRAHVLIHDAAHTTAAEAAQVAAAAGVRKLLLIHCLRGPAARLLREARVIFPNTDLAPEGQRVEVKRTVVILSEVQCRPNPPQADALRQGTTVAVSRTPPPIANPPPAMSH